MTQGERVRFILYLSFFLNPAALSLLLLPFSLFLSSSGFTTGLDESGFGVCDSEASTQYLLAYAMREYDPKLHEDPQDPDQPYHQASPVIHTCLRLYPALTRWLLNGGMMVWRADNLMVLGEWQPIPHDKLVYLPSIMS